MIRRAFLVGASASLLAPRFVRAQQARVRRIAVVHPTTPVAEMTETTTVNPGLAVMLVELRRLGLVEGQNLVIQRYSGLDYPDREEMARVILAASPELICTLGFSGGLLTTLAATTKTIPILFSFKPTRWRTGW